MMPINSENASPDELRDFYINDADAHSFLGEQEPVDPNERNETGRDMEGKTPMNDSELQPNKTGGAKMSKPYRIEKNIKIPKRRGKWSELGQQMEVGDSALVNTRVEALMLRNSLIIQGFKSVSRTEGKQIRVWKVNKDL